MAGGYTLDVTKFAVVLISCIAASVLCYFGKMESQAVVAILSAALGYVFGNGHGIATSQAVAQQVASLAASFDAQTQATLAMAAAKAPETPQG